ncbi:lysM domain-containing protein [Colletotrichum higginsianum]|nr:LysM domain-containing protein [Colletotrichum higginsianum]GJD02511.1 lysM domain-containing protein [Colletotrichum higginsianum]
MANCTTWYSAESGESCAVVLGRIGLTVDQFFTFNPSVKSDCSGMVIGTHYCISTEADGSPPGATDYQPPPSTTTVPSSPTGIATPTPVQPGMISNCNKFYKVVSGDGCWAIADDNKIPLEDFYSWNPAIKTDCSGLQADVYVCVGVSVTQLPPMTTTTTAGDASPATPTPTQQGMVNGCGDFYKVQPGDGCWAIADANGVPLESFYSWNPAVKTDCTGLQADVFVCVGLRVAGTPQPTAAATTTTAAGAGATPSPIQDGMVANCVAFYLVRSGDGCWAISDAKGIALDDFYGWNPAVKTDCTGLQANVYVCVGVA